MKHTQEKGVVEMLLGHHNFGAPSIYLCRRIGCAARAEHAMNKGRSAEEVQTQEVDPNRPYPSNLAEAIHRLE